MNAALKRLAFLVLLLSSVRSFSQELVIVPDSVAQQQSFDYAKRFDPRKALFFAAVLPGMGQVYNNKYWKLPIVYGGFAAGIYVMDFYQKEYAAYRTELLENLSGNTFPSTPSNLSEATLRRVVDFYRRKRDFTIVLMGLGYLLQIVDAHVDAHLKEFKYNPNLKRIGLAPELNSDQLTGRTAGFTITYKLSK
ncbi:MAG: hypothetical protein FJZ78_07295 [Bacteroidetes bacterium]|nr:hypothetical protein [Bacteroidota bacterium]